jgi:hypothetical protein
MSSDSPRNDALASTSANWWVGVQFSLDELLTQQLFTLGSSPGPPVELRAEQKLGKYVDEGFPGSRCLILNPVLSLVSSRNHCLVIGCGSVLWIREIR